MFRARVFSGRVAGGAIYVTMLVCATHDGDHPEGDGQCRFRCGAMRH